jgi:hypothetical protein
MKRTAMLVLLVVSVLGLALASAASAGTVVRVSGTDVGPDSGTTVCQPVDSSGLLLNCAVSGFVTNFTGDLTGTLDSSFTLLINCHSSRFLASGVETFTGSVAGVGSGTVTWAAQLHATFNCSTGTLSNLVGTGTIVSGTGALAGLHGTLIFTGDTYTGILSQ